MDLLSQALVILAAFAGLGVGYVLALISPEEMVLGKKYFLVLEKSFRILVFVPAVYLGMIYSEWLFLALLLAGIAVSFFIKDFGFRLLLLYLLFVLMMFVAVDDYSVYLMQASLVFLYGLVGGTLFRSQTYS